MISCTLSSDSVCGGETALFLLRGSNSKSPSNRFENSIIFAQIHGHINADFRWLKSSKKIQDYFIDPQSSSLEKFQASVVDPLPVAANHTSYCIFSTSRVAVSPTHIFERGSFLEFEVPGDILPSFKGLCASINYYITLFIQFPASNETIDFPIVITGVGSSSVPYQIR